VDVVARQRSTNRALALKMWLKSGRQMKLKDIAAELGVSDVQVRQWKYLDKWDEIPAKRPRGAPKGNKNAKGNKGGGAPKGNKNALKHGLYSKFLPQNQEFQELLAIVSEMDPLDMLWHAVEIAFAKLLWAQQVMFVTGKDEMIKEVKKQKFDLATKGSGKDKETVPVVTEEEYEFQFAWDRQATDIKAYVAIAKEFRAAVKQFLAAAPENDERRLKLALMEAQVEKINAETEKVKGGGKNPEAENWIDALKKVAESRRAQVNGDE